MSTDHKIALEPTILVIFGITGDLSKRYLLPSLYHLVKNDLLHKETEIIGITRGTMTLDELLETVELCVNEVDGVCDPAAVTKLRTMLSLRHMDVTKPSEYDVLLQTLNEIEDAHGTHMNRLYYLSIPPAFAAPIVTLLGEKGLNASCQHGAAQTRLLVEKPFGSGIESAKELIGTISQQFGDDQVYRIDHYLAKETVQNILAFRFNNPVFEPVWNAEHIEYIEVLAHEKIGIEGRVNFYEQTGALRDLIQSHLLQILALVTMEKPEQLTSDAIHSGKLEVMTQMRAVSKDEVDTNTVRGQYSGYTEEVSNPKSLTETYAAIRVFIDNTRWKTVPMIVKSGKGLKERISEVNVVFKPTDQAPHHNVLTFRIQPNEAIELSLRIKKPGYDDEIQPVEMAVDSTAHKSGYTPTAYEKVLIDAVRGDQTLFASAEEIIESWRVVQPVLDSWTQANVAMHSYEVGSDGPDTAYLYPTS